jgi:hypothetical protein
MKIFSIDDLQNAAEKSVQFSKLVKLGEFTAIQSKYQVLTNNSTRR